MSTAPDRLAFTVPGEPRGKGRPRIVKIRGYSRMATDAKTAAYENLVALAAQQALGERAPLEGALAVHVTIRLAPAASASRRARAAMLAGELRPTKKPDADNVLKALLDGLNGIAFRDDAQVVELSARKLYAASPGLDVMVHRIEAGARCDAVRPTEQEETMNSELEVLLCR